MKFLKIQDFYLIRKNLVCHLYNRGWIFFHKFVKFAKITTNYKFITIIFRKEILPSGLNLLLKSPQKSPELAPEALLAHIYKKYKSKKIIFLLKSNRCQSFSTNFQDCAKICKFFLAGCVN